MHPAASIIIDGSNFYFKLRDLGLQDLLAFDFAAFARYVSGDTPVGRCTYHVGAVRFDGSEKSRGMQANQQMLLAHLRRSGLSYQLGYLLKSDGAYHEKGVDVNMALQIALGAEDASIGRIILVSSDTDLIPAIHIARACGKSVEYVGFAHKPSLALIANCSASHLLAKTDLLPFVARNQTNTKKNGRAA